MQRDVSEGARSPKGAQDAPFTTTITTTPPGETHREAQTPDAANNEELSNDSEAETEILPASKAPSPMKQESGEGQDRRNGQDKDLADSSDGIDGRERSDRRTHSRQNGHAGAKRKAQEEPSDDRNGHSRTTRSNIGSPNSPTKKPKLSPDSDYPRRQVGSSERNDQKRHLRFGSPQEEGKQSQLGTSDDGEHQHGTSSSREHHSISRPYSAHRSTHHHFEANAEKTSSPFPSPPVPTSPRPSNHASSTATNAQRRFSSTTIAHNAASTTSPSNFTSASPPQRVVSSEVPTFIDSISNRAATHEPRTRSESPHRLHRRSSSFQATHLANEADRRHRTRRAAQTPTLSGSTLKESTEQGPYTSLDSPSSAGHMAHRGKDVDGNGATALARACEKGTVELVKQILDESHDDLERPDHAGNRPLQKAALEGHVTVVEMLIKAGCEVNVANDPDRLGADTPLIDAIENEHVEVVRVLLDAGANPWQKNVKCKMPKDCLDLLEGDVKHQLHLLLDLAADRHLADDTDVFQTNHFPPRATKDLSRLNPLHTVKEMEVACLQGDLDTFNTLQAMKVKPNLACAVAAARGGHLDIFQKIINRDSRLQIDPDPDIVNQTPILAAIGRGNLDLIRFILAHSNFQPDRKVNGLAYYEIAAERKGPQMKLEVKILREAADHLGTEIESPAINPVDASPTGDASMRDLGDSSPASGASQLQAKRKRLISRSERNEELRAKAQEEEERIVVEAAERYLSEVDRAKELRTKYLRSLPYAVARALTPGHRLVAKMARAEDQWMRTLEYWNELVVVKRSELEQSFTAGTGDDLFTLNIFVAIFLHHDTLTACKDDPSLSAIPATPEHRRAVLFGALNDRLHMDQEWHRAPFDLARESGWSFSLCRESGKVISTRGVHAAQLADRERYFALPEEEIFWVSMDWFLAQTVQCEWLRDMTIYTDSSVRLVEKQRRTYTPAPRYMNGRMTHTSDKEKEAY